MGRLDLERIADLDARQRIPQITKDPRGYAGPELREQVMIPLSHRHDRPLDKPRAHATVREKAVLLHS
jgi:hypothetical protein